MPVLREAFKNKNISVKFLFSHFTPFLDFENIYNYLTFVGGINTFFQKAPK